MPTFAPKTYPQHVLDSDQAARSVEQVNTHVLRCAHILWRVPSTPIAEQLDLTHDRLYCGTDRKRLPAHRGRCRWSPKASEVDDGVRADGANGKKRSADGANEEERSADGTTASKNQGAPGACQH